MLGGAGRDHAGRDADKSVRPRHNRLSYPPRHRTHLSWTILQEHERAKCYVNRWINKTSVTLFVPGCWPVNQRTFLFVNPCHAKHVRKLYSKLLGRKYGITPHIVRISPRLRGSIPSVRGWFRQCRGWFSQCGSCFRQMRGWFRQSKSTWEPILWMKSWLFQEGSSFLQRGGWFRQCGSWFSQCWRCFFNVGLIPSIRCLFPQREAHSLNERADSFNEGAHSYNLGADSVNAGADSLHMRAESLNVVVIFSKAASFHMGADSINQANDYLIQKWFKSTMVHFLNEVI